MRLKCEFEVLGIIKSQAANGLSVFEKSSKGGVISGQISGGEIGDVVVRDSAKNGQISIISASLWKDMPKDEEAKAQLVAASALDIKQLQLELANLKSENLELKTKIAQLEAKKGGKNEPKESEASLNLDTKE